MVWTPFENGQTLGTTGSENGVILCDEEHSVGARITLEQGSYAPFAITCGIFGVMVHTAFASSELEARTKYEVMKQRLEGILAEPDQEKFFLEIEKFIQEF